MDRSPPPYQPLLRVVIAVAVGIGLDRLFGPSPVTWVSVMLAGTMLWALSFRLQRFRLSSVTLLIALLALGGVWHNLHWNWIGKRDIGTFATLDSQPVVVRGRIAGQPKWIAEDKQQEKYTRPRGVRSRLVLRLDSIRDRGRFRHASGNVELFVEGRVQDLRTSDRIELAGELATVRPVSNPGAFDLQEFFRGRRTLCWMSVPFPESLKRIEDGILFDRAVSSLRTRLDALLWTYLSEDTAPLASAMLLGNRDQLDRGSRDSFLLSGTVHLLAISGLHVGILASLFLLLPRLGFVSRRKGLLLTMLFVCFYAGLVEFRPPVTRAAILICVYCYCRWIGRAPFSFNTLALAALVVLAFNPVELFGAGAQLSFLAVGSLIYARHWISWPKSDDPIDRLIENSWSAQERCWRNLGRTVYSAFAVSGIIWLFAVPAVACQFHLVAPIALLANPLLLIPLSTGLICGMGVIFFGGWLPPAAHLMAAGCDGSLWMIQQTAGVSEQVPGGHWWTAGPPLVAMLVFYSVLLVVYLRFDGLKFRTLAAAMAIWLVLGWIMPQWKATQAAQERDTFCVTVIDVGHGGCVLLQLPQGKNVLYDCGSFGSPRNAQAAAASVLWKNRISRLDAVIISHGDSDHFNGVPALARKFSIDRVIVSERMFARSAEEPMIKDLLDELRQQNIAIGQVSAGDSLDLGGNVHLDVLNPPATGFIGSDNANSIVLDVQFDSTRMLLPGDLEKEGLQKLLSLEGRQYDLVMAPHHGSKNSSPHEFLCWSMPRIVVVSASRGKNTHLESCMPADHRGKLLHTGYDGAVRIEVANQRMAVQTWASQPWCWIAR